MKCESRDEANDPLGQTLSRFCQAMVRLQRGIGNLIESPREPDDFAIPLHTADRCGGYTDTAQFRQTHDSVRLEEVAGNLALGIGLGH